MKYFDLTVATPLSGVTSPLTYTVSASDSYSLTKEVFSDPSCTDVTLTYSVSLLDNSLALKTNQFVTISSSSFDIFTNSNLETTIAG